MRLLKPLIVNGFGNRIGALAREPPFRLSGEDPVAFMPVYGA
jgi:hypothetical protein